MQSAIELLNRLSGQWAQLAFALVWQSTVIGMLIAMIADWLPKSAPALRYWLWQILAIKLLLMPCWVLAVPPSMFYSNSARDVAWYAKPNDAANALPVAGPRLDENTIGQWPTVARQSPSAVRWMRLSWQAWLVVVWLVAMMVQVRHIVYQRLRLRDLLREASPASGKLATLTEQLASQMGLKYSPATLVTGRDVSPFVCGVLRPRIVLPEHLHRTLTDEQLKQVILHELAHLKRGDLVWSWLPEVARIVYSFHPLVYWMNYRIRLERELACDQAAIAASGRSAPEYADMLVRVARQSSRLGGRHIGTAG